ncbi:hypothetical protein ACRARG_13915 [Pseudooceanicola sp. C21-150M6]|uniref:hypothetical protein n=1 Tax=Pseudooceanicola sp. C21-150M6 TaxID=3434355 RepID=UPI003D7FF5AF
MDVTHYALVTGPFVGRTSLSAVALALREAGAKVTEPDPHAAFPDALPSLETWAEALMEMIPSSPAPILVGYSVATVLAAWLAPKVGAKAVIFLDGEIPAENGPNPIFSDRVTRHLSGKVEDATLPHWSDWWTGLGLEEGLGTGPLGRDRADLVPILRAEERRFPADWLGQSLDMPQWRDMPVGYVRLSPFYDQALQDAEMLGWPVAHVDGSHLHTVLNGVETAGALMAVAGELLG